VVSDTIDLSGDLVADIELARAAAEAAHAHVRHG